MKFHRVTLALGTNLGDREKAMQGCRILITENIGPIVKASSVVETAAWGLTDQPDFLNQVVVVNPRTFNTNYQSEELSTRLLELLDLTQAIEKALGRERHLHWGPRTCDVDIIFVDRLRYEDDRFSLPHPWWRERDFVGGLIERELPDLLPFGHR